MSTSIVMASASPFRQVHYAAQLRRLGYDVHLADGGVECLQQARQHSPDVVIIEVSLPWGGSDGVLALIDDEPSLRDVSVIVIEGTRSSAELYRLSQYTTERVFLFQHFPSSDELTHAVAFSLRQRLLFRTEAGSRESDGCGADRTQSPARRDDEGDDSQARGSTRLARTR